MKGQTSDKKKGCGGMHSTAGKNRELEDKVVCTLTAG